MNNSYLAEYNDPYRDCLEEIFYRKMKSKASIEGFPTEELEL